MAAVPSLTVQTSWLHDTEGRLRAPEVVHQPFEKFDGVLAKGYTQGHLWVRLRIEPPAAPPHAIQPEGEWVVRLRPSFLDHVELYDPAFTTKPQTSGDMHPWSEDKYRSLALNFVIPSTNQPRDVYLMVRSTSSMLFYPEVLTRQEAMDSDRQIYLYSGLLTGLLLAFALWSLIELQGERDAVMLAFVVKQAVVFLHALAYLGYWRVWFSDQISPVQVNHSFNTIVFTMTASAIVFVYMLLREYQPSRWLMRILLGTSLCLPIALVLVAMGQTQLALEMIGLLSLALPLLTVITSFTIRNWHDPERGESPLMTRPQLIGFFVVLLLMLWIYAVQILGFLSLGADAIYGILSYNLLTSGLMVYVLNARARHRQRMQVIQTERLASSERRALFEAERRSEQRQFIDMLAHELTTLIATVRMNLSSATPQRQAISQATVDMQSIIDRVVQTGKLDDGDFPGATSSVHVLQLVRQISDQLQLQALIKIKASSQPTLIADPVLLHTIINNLLDNARKYSQSDSLIELTLDDHTHNHQPGVLLSVANLPGRAEWPHTGKVFEKYYRHPQARHMAGSGLGLYLVRLMVQKMRGYIQYTPSSTHVCFTVWLPLTASS